MALNSMVIVAGRERCAVTEHERLLCERGPLGGAGRLVAIVDRAALLGFWTLRNPCRCGPASWTQINRSARRCRPIRPGLQA